MPYFARRAIARDGELSICSSFVDFGLEVSRAIDGKVACMSVLKIWIAVAALAAALVGSAMARDDGRYAGSPLKPWFDTLKSSKGLCCSDADGFAVSDP